MTRDDKLRMSFAGQLLGAGVSFAGVPVELPSDLLLAGAIWRKPRACSLTDSSAASMASANGISPFATPASSELKSVTGSLRRDMLPSA